MYHVLVKLRTQATGCLLTPSTCLRVCCNQCIPPCYVIPALTAIQKQTNQKSHSTKLWFSCLVRHPDRKWSSLFLQQRSPVSTHDQSKRNSNDSNMDVNYTTYNLLLVFRWAAAFLVTLSLMTRWWLLQSPLLYRNAYLSSYSELCRKVSGLKNLYNIPINLLLLRPPTSPTPSPIHPFIIPSLLIQTN